MKKTLTLAFVLGLMGATSALAQSTEQRIRSNLRAQGFTQIEIERDDGKIEVEAKKGRHEYEMTYSRSGRLLERERELRDDDDRKGKKAGKKGGKKNDKSSGRKGKRDRDDDDRRDRDDDRDDRGGRRGDRDN